MQLSENISLNRSILLMVVAGLSLSACGGKEASDPGLDKSTKVEREAPTAKPEPGTKDSGTSDHFINAFTLAVSPEPTTNPTPKPSELQLVGGCASGQPLSMGIYRGSPGMDGYFHLSFDSVDPVTSGQTGAIKLASIKWDDGAITPANLPADSGVMVPNRFTGAGMLTINSHTGMGHAGRMSGDVKGDVKNSASGKTVSVSASFDINLACGL